MIFCKALVHSTLRSNFLFPKDYRLFSRLISSAVAAIPLLKARNISGSFIIVALIPLLILPLN